MWIMNKCDEKKGETAREAFISATNKNQSIFNGWTNEFINWSLNHLQEESDQF